jgi:hypothetical protein
MSIYDEHHLRLQEQFESRDLAGALEFAIVKSQRGDEAIAFIEDR